MKTQSLLREDDSGIDAVERTHDAHHQATEETWEAKNEAKNREVLSILGDLGNRDTDDLLDIYEAASKAYGAWMPPQGAAERPGEWSYLFAREDDRAWRIMEATANELATRKADSHTAAGDLVRTLADWFDKCDDNPAIGNAIIELIDAKRYKREVLQAAGEVERSLAATGGLRNSAETVCADLGNIATLLWDAIGEAQSPLLLDEDRHASLIYLVSNLIGAQRKLDNAVQAAYPNGGAVLSR